MSASALRDFAVLEVVQVVDRLRGRALEGRHVRQIRPLLAEFGGLRCGVAGLVTPSPVTLTPV